MDSVQEEAPHEDLRKETLPEQTVYPERKVKERARITFNEIEQIRRVIIGIHPYVKITKLDRDANSATSVYSDILRLRGSSVRKVEEKWWK